MGVFSFLFKKGERENPSNDSNPLFEKDQEDYITSEGLDPLFEDAARLIVAHQQGSTSLIQRKLAISYSHAGHIMEQLEKAGIIEPIQENKIRSVLCSDENDLELLFSTLSMPTSSIQLDELSTNKKEEEIMPVTTKVLKQYQTFLPPEIFAEILLSRSDNDYISISKKEFDKIINEFNSYKEFENKLFESTKNNNAGIACEENGKIEIAINIYEKNIKIGYPATHSYDRLMILYRKMKDYPNEARVTKRAIDIFSSENKKRFERAIQEHPELSEEIKQAFPLDEKVMGNGGFYIYVPYNVKRYKERLEKINKKLD